MWEVVARQPPFHGIKPMQIAFGVVHQGLRPPIPPSCPLVLAALMKDCWHHDYRMRPSFSLILERLKGISI
jgi:hypothetical protein